MVERRGWCWEYDGETGRQAQLQAGLFETPLVGLSIPWVDDQSVGENSVLGWRERVACQRSDVACRRVAIPTLVPVPVPSKYWYCTVCDPVAHKSNFHAVDCRRSQCLQRMLYSSQQSPIAPLSIL